VAVLRKEAASVVQSALPPTKQQLELCLWPALSKYAEELLDRRLRLDSVKSVVSARAPTGAG
jgi:hypothetical protein